MLAKASTRSLFVCILVHTAGLGSSCHCSSVSLGSGLVGHQGLGGQYAGSDGSSVLQGGTGHLGGIHDTCGDHVNILLGVSVVAVANLLGGADLLVDHAAVHTGVFSDLADGSLQSGGNDLGTGLLVTLQLGQQLLNSSNSSTNVR